MNLLTGALTLPLWTIALIGLCVALTFFALCWIAGHALDEADLAIRQSRRFLKERDEALMDFRAMRAIAKAHGRLAAEYQDEADFWRTALLQGYRRPPEAGRYEDVADLLGTLEEEDQHGPVGLG